MLGGVETQDVLALAGTGIYGAQMFPSLHFPDCSHYSIFFHSVISDLFRVCFRRDFISGGSRALAYFSFVFRHTNSTTLQCLWVCAGAANCCTQRAGCPAERLTAMKEVKPFRPLCAEQLRPSLADPLRRPVLVPQCRSECA